MSAYAGHLKSTNAFGIGNLHMLTSRTYSTKNTSINLFSVFFLFLFLFHSKLFHDVFLSLNYILEIFQKIEKVPCNRVCLKGTGLVGATELGTGGHSVTRAQTYAFTCAFTHAMKS